MTAKSIQKSLSFTHPKLQAVVDDFVNGVKLSMHRALSQHGPAADAARASMPGASDSLEQVFARYLKLPRAANSLRTAAQTATLPPAPAGVKLNDPTPVLDQLVRQRQSNRFGFTAGEARELVANRRIIDDGGPAGDFDFGGQDGGGDPTPRKLIQLRIHKVKCLKETSGEWGDDEIALGGYMIDDEGEVIKVREFYVSKNFNSGETKAYNPPKPFASFVAKKNGQKKIVLATLALAEKDQGGFASFLDDLWSKVTLQATVFAGALYAALTALVPGQVWAYFLPGVLSGLLIGILVAAAITAVFALLASWLKDDIFKPVSTAFYVPTIDTPVVTPTDVASFNGHGGRYQITYDWAVVT